MVLAMVRRQQVQQVALECEGQVSAWLKKTKSDSAKLKWLSGSNKRYFTIDFDAQVFYYSHSKDQKGISEKVAFQDIISIEEILPNGKTGKKGATESKSFRVVTRSRVFDLQASSISEAEQWVQALGVAKDRGLAVQVEGEETERPVEQTGQPARPQRGASATSSLWSAQNMDGRRGSAGGTSSNTDPSTGGSTATPQPEQENGAGRLAVPELNLTDDGNLQDAGKATPNSARQPSCFGTPTTSPSKRGEEAPLSQWGKLDELEEMRGSAESGANQASDAGNVAPEKVAKIESEPQEVSRSIAPIGAPLEAKKPEASGATCAGSGPDLSKMPPPPPAPRDAHEAAPPPSVPQTMGEQQVAMPPMPPLEPPAAMSQSNAGSGPDLAAVPPPPGGETPATSDLPPLKPSRLPPVMSGGSGPNLAGLPPPPAAAAPLTKIGAGIPLKKPLPQTSGTQQLDVKPEAPAATAVPPQVATVPQTSLEKRNAIWKWADQDCDGMLNREEVERFVLKMEGQPLHYAQYVQMCKMFGADANIGLLPEHFLSMYDKGMSNADEDFEKIASDRQQAGAPMATAPTAIEEPKIQATSKDESPEVVREEDRVPCPHCGRRFAVEAAARHVPICQRAKAKPSREKRRTITAVRTAPSSDVTPAVSSTAGVAGKGEEPSGWDSDENIQTNKTQAAAKPAVQKVPEGPATGQEASGWDSDDEIKAKNSDDEGKDQALNARPKKLAPLAPLSLEFDMTSGPKKACPKNLAERLSKKSSKKSKREKDAKSSAEVPSGWDSEEEKGSKTQAAQPLLANDALDRPVSAGFVAARNKSTPKGGSVPASSPEGEVLNQLLGEITTDDLKDVGDDHQLVPDFLCTQCDRQVLRINHHVWNQGVTYMFLRNNYPNALSLRSQLILKKGCCAYCCQCSSRSADIQAELEDVANGLRWRVVQASSAVS
mmetsp:Transcript_9890/g.22486  ORF Transcript_9890/g.22486 Transcript_9890/m.22486 type:complete len:942 (+) Transcript_9890:68-2893(+)